MNRISQRLSMRDPVPKSHRLFDSLSGPLPAGQSSSSSALPRRSFGANALPPPAATSLTHSSRPSLSDRIATLPDPRESLRLASTIIQSTSSGRRSTESAKHSDKDELIEEEEEEYYAHPSPAKSRSAKRRVMSGDEDADEEEYDRVHTDEAHSPGDAEEEAAVEQEVTTGPFSQGSDKTDAPAISAGKDVQGEKADALAVKIERMSLSKGMVDRLSWCVPWLTELFRIASIKTPDLLSLIGPLDSMEKTFLISVDYDDGDPEGPRCSTFKTKGRHTVQKVLFTVCRTFGVEAYFSQAQLVLVVEEETDDDQVFEHKYMCEKDDTMEKAGARPDSRFLLVLDDLEEA
ncbi:hypothetical protein EIP86_008339 [Pleurotus ostreatoroseus]|nr:hypothetical protein EIP86_008339 [Pleurotus ostreatoroseus]